MARDLHHNGIAYIATGFDLAFRKGVRRYVMIPLTINVLLFGAAIGLIIQYAPDWVSALLSYLPSWLHWLEVLIWPLLVISVLLVFALTFTSVANIIAAPFNSLLAEKVEQQLTGVAAADGGVKGMIRDIPRILMRELQKILYFIPRLIGFALLLFVPLIGQVLWFLFGGWMMTIQYADYPFDNHKVPFAQMRRELWRHKGKSLSFGCSIAILSSIPLINLVMIPVAVAAATAMWVDHMRNNTLG
ncbi:sulfate transporter CysZ [Pseudidiomarina taiwanensis]|uniref:Sulfate transporter CysZ n=1 Tax=Pseudidiomarina taiwanensis TaxID=337250 RepID=A0A432ZMG7_9GAMM|nr:sulfate transporter CysZ [Pseudidiomarina taiwanensis]RUO79062.1 sulfate transporter CysZ [Pseudidiomarina taiwanensis]